MDSVWESIWHPITTTTTSANTATTSLNATTTNTTPRTNNYNSSDSSCSYNSSRNGYATIDGPRRRTSPRQTDSDGSRQQSIEYTRVTVRSGQQQMQGEGQNSSSVHKPENGGQNGVYACVNKSNYDQNGGYACGKSQIQQASGEYASVMKHRDDDGKNGENAYACINKPRENNHDYEHQNGESAFHFNQNGELIRSTRSTTNNGSYNNANNANDSNMVNTVNITTPPRTGSTSNDGFGCPVDGPRRRSPRQKDGAVGAEVEGGARAAVAEGGDYMVLHNGEYVCIDQGPPNDDVKAKKAEEFERGNWTGKLDFILSAIGYAVGLGNVWRFPYLAYKNGGASFLFPYIIMLIIAGLPLFFLELAIGQFTSEGPITCWKMAPAFMGIGYGMVIISAVVSIYYNMIIAWAVYYMLVSFVHMDGGLPWESCNNPWNDKDTCRYEALPKLDSESWEGFNEVYDWSCIKGTMLNESNSGYLAWNSTYADLYPGEKLVNSSLTVPRITGMEAFREECGIKYVTPAEQYYEYYVLGQKDNVNMNDIGDVSLKLALTLFAAWMLIFGCLMKGIKTSGKVVYFTATFPYAVLVVLLIRGVTLEGHEAGIDFYVIPEWDKLTDATIWGQAATQIFYSLGIGFGGLLTMASYNKFDNNVYRDAVLVAIINCGTSIFAGFAIFSLLGHMAFVTNQKVENVATSGAGLAFVAYPDGISRLPASPVWAFLFFFMILTLGMDSQFAMMETVISAVSDIFPRTLRKYKTPFTFLVCIVGFLLGIPLCTEGGGRVLTLMNDYSGSYNLMIIALFEIIALCYVYGMSNFKQDIEMMIGKKNGCWWTYWTITWCAITPAAIIFIVVVSSVQYAPSSYEGVEILDWAEGIGWLMVVTPLVVMICVGIIQICRMGFKEAFMPMGRWGPAQPENQVGRYAHLNVGDDGAYRNYGGEEMTMDTKPTPPPSYNGNNNGGFDNLAVVPDEGTERL